jgi:N-carbamoylputrescine amidase
VVPELARAYSIAGAEVLVYPTAIGSEPDHPDFDTEPLWSQVIVGQRHPERHVHGRREPHRHRGAADVLRLVVHLRPVRAKARAGPARRGRRCSVADLDLDQRRDWLELFPFLRTRRPDAYASLLETIKEEIT